MYQYKPIWLSVYISRRSSHLHSSCFLSQLNSLCHVFSNLLSKRALNKDFNIIYYINYASTATNSILRHKFDPGVLQFHLGENSF